MTTPDTATPLVLIDGAHGTRGEWEFDPAADDHPEVDLTPAQHAAAVRIVDQPENADCERGSDCVNLRPTLIVGGEVRKRGADFIGFHLAEDPDTGYERMVFKPFYVTADGQAICEACAFGRADTLSPSSKAPQTVSVEQGEDGR